MTLADFQVQGMTCANCTKTVSQAIAKVDGVKSCRVDLSKERVHLFYDESKVSPEYLQKAVRSVGYDLVIDTAKSRRQARIRNIVTLVFASIFLVLGILLSLAHIPGIEHSSYGHFFHNDILGIVLGTLALVILGFPIIRRAFFTLLSKRAGMDALISLSALSSYAVSLYISIANLVYGRMEMSYFDALLMVLSVVSIGSFLEAKVKALSGSQTRSKGLSSGGMARIKAGSRFADVPFEQVLKGDVCLVSPGAAIPADGTVIEGEALIDSSSFTGESTPKKVAIGDRVFASTLCVDGHLSIRADVGAMDSTAIRIERDSYALNYSKGKLGKLSDRIAAWFVPVAIILAIAGFFISFFAIYAPDASLTRAQVWEKSIVNAASVLVVSCPCAFGLAVPLTSLNGYYLALKKGIIFRDGATFERVKGIDAFIFDKTGTLTDGKMKVVSFTGDDRALSLAKGLEAYSFHPIAKGILAYRTEVKPLALQDVREVAGQGVFSAAGSLVALRGGSEDGYTRVALADGEGKPLGVFALEDSLARGAKEALAQIRQSGIRTYILTGDGKDSALRLGSKLGFDPASIRYALSPADKEKLVGEIASQGVAAYVGDGINDLGAMAASSLSIATASAVPLARERADCSLVGDGLAPLLSAVKISQRCYRIIVENFIWAFLYNLVLIPLAMVGLLFMWLCSLTMILSNITLMLNSLRASRLPQGK